MRAISWIICFIIDYNQTRSINYVVSQLFTFSIRYIIFSELQNYQNITPDFENRRLIATTTKMFILIIWFLAESTLYFSVENKIQR